MTNARATDRPSGLHVLVLLCIGALPWTAIAWSGGIQVVALWGLVNPAPPHVVSLPDYLFVLTTGLPDRLLAWPASAVLYVAGLAAIGAEWWDHGDLRLTAGLFGLSALAHLGFAIGAAARGTATVLPVGPILLGLVLWWFDWPSIRKRVARER